MAIRIPKATDAGLGREAQRPVNVTQDINASPIGPNNFSVATEIGQAGKSISRNLGNVAVERYKQQMKVADENAVLEFYTGFAKEVNENANVGENAWFSRKGKNALGIYDEAQQTMDKLAEKYSQNLANDRQRNQFLQRVGNHRLSMEESISRYEANQRSAYNIETEKSFVQTNIQNASLNYTDPKQIKNAEDNIIQITKENREGLPEDALNLRVQARISTLRTEVIGKLSNTSPYKAYALFQKTKDSLTPEDRERANNYVERGAEENFYALLEKDPVKAQEALDKGFYGGILDNKKRNQFRNAIDTQVNNMARRAETNQFLSTLKNENQLFDSIVGSNREDAFAKLYQYSKGFNADPVFVEKTRNILLESKSPSLDEKEAAITNLESTFQSFEGRVKDGKQKINTDTATLSNLVEFNRNVELARLKGEITNEQANSYRKRSTPILIEATKREQGYDDKGLEFWWGKNGGGEDYDKGTQAIQDYVDQRGLSNNSPEKVRMMSRFIELYDQMPEQIKTDPRARDKEIDNLVKFVVDEKAKVDSPTLRALGVPNAVVDENGKINNIKEGPTDAKISESISEDFVIKKSKSTGQLWRVYKDGRKEPVPQESQKTSFNFSNPFISEANAAEDTSGQVLKPGQTTQEKLGGIILPTPMPKNLKGLVDDGTINVVQRPPKKTTILEDGGKFYIVPTTDEDGNALDARKTDRQFIRTNRHFGGFDSESDAKSYQKTLSGK